ncbi:MAG: hypothetical protein HY784_07390 [Chloroflexi bacterium]|nr:hypothetical protein [Chloroflexota bacterium]
MPFFATQRYIFAPPDQPVPPGAELIHDFDGIQLWRDPNALPFAFSAPPASLQPYATLTTPQAARLAASLDGVNRVVVSGAPARPGDQLVVLVSDYPGWRLYVDGKAAEVLPANRYLGAQMLPGRHTYVFAFQPAEYYAGLAISLASLLLLLGMLLADARPTANFRRLRPISALRRLAQRSRRPKPDTGPLAP